MSVYHKLSIKLPCDPEISLLDIYPKVLKVKFQRDIGTSMFKEAYSK
jgi:hypothetical protein